MSIYKGTTPLAGIATPHLDTRNIGQIIQATMPLSDAGLHLLDGSLLTSGSYSAFITYMASMYVSNPELFTTEADWQASVSAYGICGKFVYDSVNSTIRLPKKASSERHLIKSVHNGEAWADVYSDGWCVQGNVREAQGNDSIQTIILPIPYIDTNYSVFNVSLASGTTGNARSSAMLGTNRTTTTFNITQDTYADQGGLWEAKGFVDISDYGAETIYPYIVIANSTKTEIEVDIDEVATDLNGKADTDLSNVTNTAGFRKLVEVYNNGASWYKVYREYDPSDGTYIGLWCEQGGRIEDSGSANNNYEIMLLKPYNNTNYFAIHQLKRSGNDGSTGSGWNYWKTLSTDRFSVVAWAHATIIWKAEGYIA